MKQRPFEDWNAFIEPATTGDPSDDVLSFRSRHWGREVAVEPSLIHQPEGITAAAIAAGVKHPGVLDFTVVKLDEPGSAAGVFTKNLCPSYAVQLGKRALANGRAQALAVVSKNANVFTPNGEADMHALAGLVARELAVDENDVVLSCTGVIGVPLPMAKLQTALIGFARKLRPGALDETARAILTTDARPKVCSVRVGDLVVCAMAKGAGMIEPNMATMLVYFFTNADADASELKAILTDAVERTFNSISVDSDTSTSDTAVVFSTRRAKLDEGLRADFADAVRCIALKLARDIVAQSEGATKLIECDVSVDTSAADAKLLAKRIINSPLVKTAVHGGDPNWGRLVMAIGKPDERQTIRSIRPAEVVIAMMGQVVFSRDEPVTVDLVELSSRIRASRRVAIDVRIGGGRHLAKVWGCDLGPDYVAINSEYTT
ncbi:MAG: bifunctional glutamate N-acetyltransferase/amino-acid acetyltransferase ArgJ [Myxococcota bacterium]|nr:bifunctional glutamate N-acetyltransferase/amino-acid acetyltransferase ArgJ [Myxococcota bacterium]